MSVHASNPARGLVAKIQNDSTSSQTGSQLWFNQAAVANWVIGQPAGTDAFAFWSGRADNADGTERLRIDSSGRVGIGTASPGTLLHLNATNPVLRWSGSTSGNCDIQTDGATFYINADSGNTASSSNIAFRVDNSEKARIDSSGRLLVGTSSTVGSGNLLQLAGSLGLPGGAFASSQTVGDFVITVDGLTGLNGSRWLKAAILLFYTGVDNGNQNSRLLLSTIQLGGLNTYDYQATSDIIGTTIASAVASSQTSSGVQIAIDVPNSNNGSVFALLISHGRGAISIAQ